MIEVWLWQGRRGRAPARTGSLPGWATGDAADRRGCLRDLRGRRPRRRLSRADRQRAHQADRRRHVTGAGHRSRPGSLRAVNRTHSQSRKGLTTYAVITRADIDSGRPDEAAAMLTGMVVPATKAAAGFSPDTGCGARIILRAFLSCCWSPRQPPPLRRGLRAAVLPRLPGTPGERSGHEGHRLSVTVRLPVIVRAPHQDPGPGGPETTRGRCCPRPAAARGGPPGRSTVPEPIP